MHSILPMRLCFGQVLKEFCFLELHDPWWWPYEVPPKSQPKSHFVHSLFVTLLFLLIIWPQVLLSKDPLRLLKVLLNLPWAPLSQPGLLWRWIRNPWPKIPLSLSAEMAALSLSTGRAESRLSLACWVCLHLSPAQPTPTSKQEVKLLTSILATKFSLKSNSDPPVLHQRSRGSSMPNLARIYPDRVVPVHLGSKEASEYKETPFLIRIDNA